ncbi:MAG: hypothetical protein ACHQ7N_07580 [Candidatus Methylomirabilales bacterium]
MVEQRERVLQWIAEETRQGRAISAEDLAREFFPLLSPEAACGRLKRLWAERLIVPVLFRSASFRYRLRPGETLRGLRFRLAPRGEERLQWYRQQRGGSGGWFS